MKKIKIIFFILSSALIISCSDDGDGGNSNGLNVPVTIDGASFAFTCNRNEFTSYEYEVSCNNNQSKRLIIYKAFEVNGGEVKVLLIDVPDSSLFDSPYGISYECSTNPLLSSHACLTTALPVYDAASTTISATDVVLPESDNNTAEFGTFVAGEGMHTISFSVNAESVAFFQ